MNDIFQYILNRAKERSTWLGLVSLATAAGLVLRPDVQEAIVATGMSLAGLILAVTKDSGEQS
jgi:hypothetical protein